MQSHRPPAPFAPSLHRAWSSPLKSSSRRSASPCFVYPHLSWRPHHRTIAVIPPASAPLQPCCQPLYTDPGPSEISSMFFYVVVGSLLFFCNPGAALWPPQPHAPTVGCTTILGSQCTLTRGNKCSLVATPPLFFLSFFLSFTGKQTWPLLPSRMLPFLNPPSASAAAVVTRATSTCLHPRPRAVKPSGVPSCAVATLNQT